MKIAKGKSKNAIIATGWSKAMKTYEIEEGDICIFEFFLMRTGKLGLLIHSVRDVSDSDSDMSDSSESSE